jgi:hypothetical protein
LLLPNQLLLLLLHQLPLNLLLQWQVKLQAQLLPQLLLNLLQLLLKLLQLQLKMLLVSQVEAALDLYQLGLVPGSKDKTLNYLQNN